MKRPLILAFKDRSEVSDELLSQLTGLGYEIREVEPSPGQSDQEAEACAPRIIFLEARADVERNGQAPSEQVAPNSGVEQSRSDSALYDNSTRPAGTELLSMPSHLSAETQLRLSLQAMLGLYSGQQPDGGYALSFRELVAVLPHFAYEIDADGRVLFLNRRAMDLTGFSDDDLRAGLSVESLFEPCFTAELTDSNPDCVRPARLQNLGYGVKSRTGATLPLTVHACPLREGDKVLGWRGIGVEDSKPGQAEEMLVRTNDLWQRTFDAVPDLIAIIDKNHRIVRANKAMAERMGMRGHETCGLYCHEHVHACDRPPEYCPHTGLLRDGKPRSVEIEEDFLGGIFHVTVSPIFGDDGEILGSVHVARDITESRLAAEKQNELMDELKTFTYTMSHDLRAPLANLKGFSKELEESLAEAGSLMKQTMEALPEETRSKLNTYLEEDIPEAMYFINSSVARIDRMVDAILGLSRLGRRPLERESLDMNEIVEEVLDSMAYQIGDAAVEITVGDLPKVEADRASMEQIFGNLLDNAIKHRAPDRPGKIEITGFRKGNDCEFHVVDNGMGVEQESLARVFHIFQRGRNVKVDGEGIGLAHVRTLVRAHGGRIWLKSTLGEGSDFGFTISDLAANQSAIDTGV